MPSRFNTLAKQSIRTNWAKPILSFLQGERNKKLCYLGLPSEDALDIKAWLEHLDTIYAFICRDYKAPSHPDQDRSSIIKLDAYLRELERRRLISFYEIFDGFMEEVVIKGFDNSPREKPFTIGDVVTVYNLDYCNALTSPVKFVDRDGNRQKGYKFEAIKLLMDKQAEIVTDRPKKFLFFLTIHCSYQIRNPKDFPVDLPEEYADYLAMVNALPNDKAKAPYLLKAHAFFNLSNFFVENNFLPEFLPVIHYIGNGNHPLLFFTVVGTQTEDDDIGEQALQTRDDFLNGKFISIGDQGDFVNNADLIVHGEADWQEIDPLAIFRNSATFQKHW